MVVLNIVNQLLEEIATIIDLEQRSVLLLIGVDAGDLLLHASVVLLFILLIVKETARRLHFLFELEHFNDVCFLAIAGAAIVLLSIFAFLVAEEVILRLIRIDAVVVAFVLMATRDSILVYNASSADAAYHAN
jgi:hypothetical protein